MEFQRKNGGSAKEMWKSGKECCYRSKWYTGTRIIRFVTHRPESQDQALSDTRVKNRKGEKKPKEEKKLNMLSCSPSMINRSEVNTEEERPI